MQTNMKGIILVGGTGSRLYPITRQVSKQLLPVYDKPMVYYPLSVLMLAGIREVLFISTPEDRDKFADLLGDGRSLGMSFSYAVQPKPEGLAQAFIIGKKFIGNDPVCLILGDNIFYGNLLSKILRRAVRLQNGGLIFGYLVKDPQRYGVVEFDTAGDVVSIEEKPEKPKSSFAVPGLYMYDATVVDIAAGLKPSKRGELEITDLNMAYLRAGKLKVELLGRGFAWLDTGTHEALAQASHFIQVVQERQGMKVACIEEIAYRLGYITAKDLTHLARDMEQNDYGKYLLSIAKETPSLRAVNNISDPFI